MVGYGVKVVTTGFGSVSLGSTPSIPTINKTIKHENRNK